MIEIKKIDGVEFDSKDLSVNFLGNYLGYVPSYDGAVFDKNGLAPTILASNAHGNAPKVLEIMPIGNVGGGKTQSRTVYSADGLCPKLCSGMDHGNTIPYIFEIGELEKMNKEAYSLRMVRTEEGKAIRKAYESGEVHHGFNEYREAEPREDGVSNTLTSVQKDNIVLETEKIICAMRGRNKDNPSDRTAGIELEQRLEPQEDGICNTLTSVQKDNLVLEKSQVVYDDYNSNVPEDQSVTPTLTTNCGSSATRNGVKVIKSIKIRQATKDGFILCELGGRRIWNIHPQRHAEEG